MDSCCFNRPFDDQAQARVKEETQAVLMIEDYIKVEKLDLVWSFILHYEIENIPSPEKRDMIGLLEGFAAEVILQSEEISAYAEDLTQKGFSSKDALHISCAVAAEADYFLSTDDKVLKKAHLVAEIPILNPIQFVDTLHSK